MNIHQPNPLHWAAKTAAPNLSLDSSTGLSREARVPATAIDETIREVAAERVDIMKTDVEANELGVLRGALKSLEAKKIHALAFEFGSPQMYARTFFHEYWDFPHPLGLKVSWILPTNGFYPVEEYYEDLEYFGGATNYVAYPPDRCSSKAIPVVR